MVLKLNSLLLLLNGLTNIVATSNNSPNPIIDAGSVTSLVRSVPNGKLFRTHSAPDVGVNVVHLYGTAKEMGYAQGRLLGPTILDFITTGLEAYYNDTIKGLDLHTLPEWLQTFIKNQLEKDAVGAMNTALSWVYEQEQIFISTSQSQFEDEVAGIAEGICSVVSAPCDVANLTTTLRHVNMLPELIKMQCSMVGAWGKATAQGDPKDGGGGLVQLRTLDFGTGPFANASVLIVYHPKSDNGNPFVNVGFPGTVMSVTGVSSKIGMSEKLWLITGKPVQKGTYHGKADALVIREMLQFADTKEDALKHARSTERTWAVFLGVGDFVSQEMLIMAYREQDLVVLDPANISSYTNQTSLADLVFVDKHPQPSHDPTLTTLLHHYYGNLTTRTIAQNIPRETGSGDVHVALYDFRNSQLLVSFGRTDASGSYGPNDEGKACNRPFLQYSLEALFNEPEPKPNEDLFQTCTKPPPPPTRCQENCGTGSSCVCMADPDAGCGCGVGSTNCLDCIGGVVKLCSGVLPNCKATCCSESGGNSMSTCDSIPFNKLNLNASRVFPICRDCDVCCVRI